jgi:hypothetical protein
MVAEAAALVFEARDLDSCTAIVEQFFRDHPSANQIKVGALDARSQTARNASLAGRRR